MDQDKLDATVEGIMEKVDSIIALPMSLNDAAEILEEIATAIDGRLAGVREDMERREG